MINLLIFWLVPSLIATLAIMLSSSIIEHRIELKKALIMGLSANFFPELIKMLNFHIPFPYSSTILDFALWIILAAIIMPGSIKDRIKIGSLGFIITQILIFVIPFFL